jgi:Fe-S-cluster-containing hydrogenase component 2
MALINTGVPEPEDIASKMPDKARQQKEGFCVAECFQPIPCDPCVKACPRNAIIIEGNINNVPQVDFEKCNGCGLCISHCPGLALFVIDFTYSEDLALVHLPYEFLPLPQAGQKVLGLDRSGQAVGSFEVARVLNGKHNRQTYVVCIKVPHQLANQVRAIKAGEDAGEDNEHE